MYERRQHSDLRGARNPERELQKSLRRLKKDFQKNVMPSLKRNKFHLSKNELRREKELRAGRRLRRKMSKLRS